MYNNILYISPLGIVVDKEELELRRNQIEAVAEQLLIFDENDCEYDMREPELMIKETLLYEGAYITREDFDISKTITYFCNYYNIKIPNDIEKEIADKNLSNENVEYLKKKLKIKQPVTDLKGICDAILSHKAEVTGLFEEEPDGGFGIGSDFITGVMWTGIDACYDYDSGREMLSVEPEDEFIMLTFATPFVWEIEKTNFPTNKKDCVEALRKAGEKLLKDDIDWERRLGTLSGSIILP